ncbi:MAG: bifunctional phosphoribosylaminoimidazolecarboxamide formyltransferase/IMP cyclohydrolase [Muribaculaceae bacterium]|nr:bifunctional phosphoribosylaminoimidazolecarboxamide formyltransferase/IMP cyclohydrolase [Muribaculaceae bacterium]
MNEGVKTINTALISVFNKDGLDEMLHALDQAGVKFLSTGGTQAFIQSQGYECDAVEDLTGYPSILGGRVKTLHPKVFGGILSRRDNSDDCEQVKQYDIPAIDLVVVDLYPFEQTVASGASEDEIIEKIDIGGVSLIRAAAKNFRDVAIVASKAQYATLVSMMRSNGGAATTLAQRRQLATMAFGVTSHYDTAINAHFAGEKTLRYGENPHQHGKFVGDFDAMFTQLHGKEISYNNLLDIDAAVALMADFSQPTFAILKHNNACGVATRDNLADAFTAALAGDPVSAFGGVLIANREIDTHTAELMNKLFIEVCIAPAYTDAALEILTTKKNRVLLVMKPINLPATTCRSALNGMLVQQRDTRVETEADLRPVTTAVPTASQVDDLLMANVIVKHSKSNAITIVKNGQLLASGVGQTSRVDALKQAIEKARAFGHSLDGAVMASDAFFPFADCVEIAHEAGITAVVQPGGSVRDQESVDYCNQHGMAMVMTGTRHFKH